VEFLESRELITSYFTLKIIIIGCFNYNLYKYYG
jgi:hypothetical protein